MGKRADQRRDRRTTEQILVDAKLAKPTRGILGKRGVKVDQRAVSRAIDTLGGNRPGPRSVGRGLGQQSNVIQRGFGEQAADLKSTAERAGFGQLLSSVVDESSRTRAEAKRSNDLQQSSTLSETDAAFPGRGIKVGQRGALRGLKDTAEETRGLRDTIPDDGGIFNTAFRNHLERDLRSNEASAGARRESLNQNTPIFARIRSRQRDAISASNEILTGRRKRRGSSTALPRFAGLLAGTPRS